MSTAPDGTAQAVPSTRIMVTGGPGPLVVDTVELEALAQRLEVAADHLVDTAAAAGGAAAAFWLFGYLYAPSAAPAREALSAEQTGLPHMADRLRALAGDLRLQALWYEEADRRVGTAFSPGVWDYGRHFAGLLPAKVEIAVRLTDLAMVGGYVGAGLDAVHRGDVPASIAAQRHTAALADYLQYSGGEAIYGSAIVDGEVIDITESTPAERTALGLTSPTDWLGVIQRRGTEYPGLAVEQALPAAPWGVAVSGPWGPGGAPRDLSGALGPLGLPGALGPLAPVELAPVILAPTALAPALRGIMPPAMPAPGRRVQDPPTGPGPALRRIEALESRVRTTGVGVVEILRTTDGDGARHWTVVVPGTQDSGFGGPNPMDNETNLRALGGAVSDMERGVTSAMEQAGIGPHEPVAMVGHSQGGIIAARLVEDPVFMARYDVEAVLTAGAPIGPVEVPGGLPVLSLEDVEDHTVGFDGQPNTATHDHVTVAVSAPGAHPPHHWLTYAGHADLLDGLDDPGVRAWLSANERAMGTTSPGARTESLVFDIGRTR